MLGAVDKHCLHSHTSDRAAHGTIPPNIAAMYVLEALPRIVCLVDSSIFVVAYTLDIARYCTQAVVYLCHAPAVP